MVRKAVLILAAIGAGWLAFSQRHDIIRYLKIKQMSAGDGHPGNVPAGGSRGYSAAGHGTPEGAGDFDAPARGGPASAGQA
jgi:hypothetical protein